MSSFAVIYCRECVIEFAHNEIDYHRHFNVHDFISRYELVPHCEVGPAIEIGKRGQKKRYWFLDGVEYQKNEWKQMMWEQSNLPLETRLLSPWPYIRSKAEQQLVGEKVNAKEEIED